VHECDERARLAGRGETSGHQLETQRLIALDAPEPVVVGDVVLAAEERDVGFAGIEARHRRIGTHETKLEVHRRVMTAETICPALGDGGHGLMPPDPDGSGDGLRGHIRGRRPGICHAGQSARAQRQTGTLQ
jgi:hypothetical protein